MVYNSRYLQVWRDSPLRKLPKKSQQLQLLSDSVQCSTLCNEYPLSVTSKRLVRKRHLKAEIDSLECIIFFNVMRGLKILNRLRQDNQTVRLSHKNHCMKRQELSCKAKKTFLCEQTVQKNSCSVRDDLKRTFVPLDKVGQLCSCISYVQNRLISIYLQRAGKIFQLRDFAIYNWSGNTKT